MRDDRQLQIFILTLLGIPGVANKTVLDILRANKPRIEAADLLDESFARSLKNRRIDKGLQNSDVSWNYLEEQADETLERANSCDAIVLQPYSTYYPQRLLINEKYPPILFAKGDIRALNSEKAVAIIGTRNPTPFGAKMGRRLAQILADDGYVIVSGLALGCDSVAHEGALETTRSYREKKAKPLYKKIVDVLRALYNKYLDLINSFNRLNDSYNRLQQRYSSLDTSFDRLAEENKSLKQVAADYDALCRGYGADRVEEQVRAIREREAEQKRQRRMQRQRHSIGAR